MQKVAAILSFLFLASNSLFTNPTCHAHTDWVEDSQAEPTTADHYFKDATAKFSAELSKQDKSLNRGPYSRSSQAINWAISQSNFGLAQELISEQIQRYPNDPHLHIALGQLLLKKNELKRVATEIQDTLSPNALPEVHAGKLTVQEQKFSSNKLPETF